MENKQINKITKSNVETETKISSKQNQPKALFEDMNEHVFDNKSFQKMKTVYTKNTKNTK